MAKRSPTAAWSRSFARLTRTALRAGTRALTRATRPAARPGTVARAKAPEPGWTVGLTAHGAASRHYRLYTPPGEAHEAPLPLVVMLHGCGQDAAGLAASTRMNRLAARERFLVLYPEQDRLAHVHGCWNWYETRTGRAQVEAAVIVAMVDAVLARGRADVLRVAIAGLSAGAGMAALVALRFPGRFRAVAMHSGVAPGAAHSTATALTAMQGRRAPVLGDAATAAHDGSPPLPPLLVIHGSDDSVVRAVNGREAALAWAEALSATVRPQRTVQRGSRHRMQVTDFQRAGRVWVSLCEVGGLGHAWSGGAAGQAHGDPAGPDASRLVWAFAQRQFRADAKAGQPSSDRTSSR